MLIGMKTNLSSVLRNGPPIYLGFIAGVEKYGKEMLAFSSATSAQGQFLHYGRQVIEQYNQLAQTIPVSVGGLVNFDLEIPVNGLRLTYLSSPVKELSSFAGAR